MHGYLSLAPKGKSVAAYQKTCNIKTPQITQMVVFVCKRHFEAALYHRPIYHSTIDLVHNWAKIKIVGCCQDLKVTLSGPPYLSFPVKRLISSLFRFEIVLFLLYKIHFVVVKIVRFLEWDVLSLYLILTVSIWVIFLQYLFGWRLLCFFIVLSI